MIRTVIRSLAPIFLTSIGTLAVIAGEFDDSPGLGGMGLIIIGISCYLNLKHHQPKK